MAGRRASANDLEENMNTRPSVLWLAVRALQMAVALMVYTAVGIVGLVVLVICQQWTAAEIVAVATILPWVLLHARN